MEQLRRQHMLQCDVFKDVCDRIFTITGKLRMSISVSLNFQVGDVGSYTLLFKDFIDKLETFVGEILGAIEADAREVATLAAECVLINVHLIVPTTPFAKMVKPLEKGA